MAACYFYQVPLVLLVCGLDGTPGSTRRSQINAVILTVALATSYWWSRSPVLLGLVVLFDIIGLSFFSGSLLVATTLRIEWNHAAEWVDVLVTFVREFGFDDSQAMNTNVRNRFQKPLLHVVAERGKSGG